MSITDSQSICLSMFFSVSLDPFGRLNVCLKLFLILGSQSALFQS